MIYFHSFFYIFWFSSLPLHIPPELNIHTPNMAPSSVYKFLRVGSWNVHGAYYNVNGFKVNKLEDQNFLNILNSHDILCLQETHTGENDLMNSHIQLFHGIPHCRKISSNNRYFGGMLLLIRKSIRKGVKILSTDNPDILGILLLKEFFGFSEDLNIWFVYAPPLGTPYLTDKEDVLESLEKKLVRHDNPIIMGDLNGKTNTSPDFVLEVTDKHSPIHDIDDYVPDIPSKRNNKDTKKVDKQGKELLEMCQTYRLRILNGRTSGDRWGLPTRYPLCEGETPSLLDYGICSISHLEKIQSFQVYPVTDLSDHCCISFKLNTPKHREEDRSIPQPSKETRGYKFDLKYACTYTTYLQNDPRFDEINNTLNRIVEGSPDQNQLDKIVEDLNEGIVDNAQKTFPPKVVGKPRKKKQQPKPARWFDNECAKLRKAHRRALAKVNKNPFDRHLQQVALHSRKEYKKACKAAERKLREKVVNKLMDIRETDPKLFWDTLKKMKEWGRETPDPSESIPPETWKDYYQKLLNKSTAKPLEISQGCSDPELDRPIELKELKEAIQVAKYGKASGKDKIIMELIKFMPEKVVKILCRIMEVMFMHAIFPTAWTTNLLKALYKKDSKDDPDNYRGLAIAPVISKLYCMILLQRLETHMIKTKVISPSQIGFTKGFRASDHVYLLKTLVTKVLKHKKKLYVAFVDFKKAYDTVDRSILLKTLFKAGVQGKFLSNLVAMYRNVNYSIKLKNGILDPIRSNLGLKQGCPLSPLLFNIYINDVGRYLKDNGPGNLTLGNTNINHFLYADDLVLLSETKEGLQDHLNSLDEFTKAKELTVNTKKSVIMIFNKSGRKAKDKFTYQNQELLIVQSFTYLGVEISASGTFSNGIKALVTKAKKAMMPLFRMIIQFKLSFHQILKLFTAYIEPILLYNAENWACMSSKEIEKCKKDHNKIYEKSMIATTTIPQLKYLKFALGVNKQCPTLAVLGETAEVPLILKGYHRMLTYWNRTREMDDNTLIKKAYMENVTSNSEWCQTIQILNCSQNLHCDDIPVAQFPSVAKKNLRANFVKYWQHRLSDYSKLKTYSLLKQEYIINRYLELPNFRDRQRITKFITSNHCLEIEKGRHNDKPREERLCKACERGAIEDEHHFLLACPAYQEVRINHLKHQPQDGDRDKQLQETVLSNTPSDLTTYLKAAFDLRDKLINFHVTKMSLCGMRFTISRGANTRQKKPITKLQVETSGTHKIKISRKHKRYAPY